MHVDTDDLAMLLEMQHIDMEIMRVNKKLKELPQRNVILEVRMKRRDVEKKRAQLDDLHVDADTRLADIDREDGTLAEKQRRLQEEIDSAGAGFRDVEARAKELGGVAKRRNTLEADLSAIGEELAKIEGMQAQVAHIMSDLDEREAQATESFVKEGGACKQELVRLESERSRAASSLPADLLVTYEKTAKRTGGVAIGRLQGASCGVCRMTIEGSRLIDLKAQGNLVTCPQCGRLLIVE